MKKMAELKVICLVTILVGLLVVSINATAQTRTEMTALEKKLYEAALKEGMFEWWDSLKLSESSAFIKAFSAKYPGIKVEFFESTSEVREEKYLSEHAAGRKTLDLTALDQYHLFKEKNLISDLSDIIKDINYPSQFCARDFMGVSVEHAVAGGVNYNSKLVSPKDVPRSWEDLLDPKWKGKKIAVDEELWLFIYLAPIWGKEKTLNYVKKLGEQKVALTKGGSHLIALLGAGEYPLTTPGSLHRFLVMKAKGAPIEWAPFGLALNKLSPWVVVRDAPHPNGAKLFLRWMMSHEGQQLVDKIRDKGNPLPGSQTSQSKVIEKLGIEIIPVRTWEIGAKELTETHALYLDAIGFPRMK